MDLKTKHTISKRNECKNKRLWLSLLSIVLVMISYSSYYQLYLVILFWSLSLQVRSSSLGIPDYSQFFAQSISHETPTYFCIPTLFDIIARIFCLVFFLSIYLFSLALLQSFLLLFISIFPLACQVSMSYYVSLFYFMLCYRWTFGIANCPMALLLIHCFCSHCL